MSDQENLIDKEDYGEPTPDSYDQGPLEERGCTDIICCIVFVVFLCGFLGIAGFAFSKGNPKKVIAPYDPDHRACGLDKAVKDYKYIYFTNPSKGNLWQTVCVKECPKGTETSLKCAPNKVVKTCLGKPVPTTSGVKKGSTTKGSGSKSTNNGGNSNTGNGNTNSGNSNSGNSNSGNSGKSNSGNSNSGNTNNGNFNQVHHVHIEGHNPRLLAETIPETKIYKSKPCNSFIP